MNTFGHHDRYEVKVTTFGDRFLDTNVIKTAAEIDDLPPGCHDAERLGCGPPDRMPSARASAARAVRTPSNLASAGAASDVCSR